MYAYKLAYKHTHTHTHIRTIIYMVAIFFFYNSNHIHRFYNKSQFILIKVKFNKKKT
jgi:hypothetical protein